MLCLCGLCEIPNEGYFKKMHHAQGFASGCCCVIPGGFPESSEVVFSLKALCLRHTRCATLPCCSGLVLETSMCKQMTLHGGCGDGVFCFLVLLLII